MRGNLLPIFEAIAFMLLGTHFNFRGFAVAAMGLASLTSGCRSRGDPSAHAQGPQAIPVKVQIARDVPVNDTTEYVATLKSRNSAVIMPQVEGHIRRIYVHSGERVETGTPLLEIDPLKQEATVTSQRSTRAAQEANLKWAEQEYQRTSGLDSAGVVSKQELDRSKAALDAARAQLGSLDAQVAEQQVQLKYYKVEAPSSGIVGDIPVHVGDRVTTTTMLTTVDRPGTLEVYIYVPIERSAHLHMNMPVQIVDAQGTVLADSRVYFISPQVDNTTQSVLVKSLIGNSREKLRTSQFIRARVIWETRNTPVVPVVAVNRIGDQYFAFIADPQNGGAFIAHQRPLKLGEMMGNDYSVLDGIKPGERIVVSGTQFLMDGAPVIPQEVPGS
jgi:RND family efflux transporter MFP subunit